MSKARIMESLPLSETLVSCKGSLTHFRSLSQAINRNLDSTGIRVEIEKYTKSRNELLVPKFAYASNGYLSDSQIVTFCDLVKSYESGKRHMLVLAPQQWGKTALILATMVLFPAMRYARTGKKSVCGVSIPSSYSLLSQLFSRLNDFINAYYAITVSGKREIEVRQYWQNMFGSKWTDILSEKFVCMRSSGKKTGEFVKTMNRMSSVEGFDTTYIEDECHHGQANDGVSDRIDSSLSNSIRRIATSATPDEHLVSERKSWEIIPAWLEDGYYGVDTLFGYEMKKMPGYKKKVPKIISDVDRYKYPLSIGDLDGIVKAIRSEHRRGSRGVLIRSYDKEGDPHNSNKTAITLENYLEDHMKVIRFYGKLDKGTNDLKTLRNQLPSNENYAIVTSSRCRMGDTMPHDTFVGVDVRAPGVTLASSMQATPGRLSGYYPDRVQPTVVLQEDHAEQMKKFYETGSTFDGCVHQTVDDNGMVRMKTRNPGLRSLLSISDDEDNKVERTRKSRNVILEEHLGSPFIKKLFRNINKSFKKVKDGRRVTNAIFAAEMKNILSPDNLRRISEEIGMPNESYCEEGDMDCGGHVLDSSRIEQRYAEDTDDFMEHTKTGGSHNDPDDSGEGSNSFHQIVWRYVENRRCPICRVFAGKKKSRKTCCFASVPHEVHILTLRVRDTGFVGLAESNRLKAKFAVKEQSRHSGTEVYG